MDSFQRCRMFRACDQNNLRMLQNMFKKKVRKNKEFVQKAVSEKLDGLTPLIRACRRGHIKVVQYLVNVCGADIHQVADWSAFYHDRQGTSPLLCAVLAGHLRIVKFLICAGANVNSTSHPKWTPLRAATHFGFPDIVTFLLDNGADLGLATWHGHPHPVAKWTRRHDDITQILAKKSNESNLETYLFARRMYRYFLKGQSIDDYAFSYDLLSKFDLIRAEADIALVMKYMDHLLRWLKIEERKSSGNFHKDVLLCLLKQFLTVEEELSEDSQNIIKKHFYDLLSLEQQRELNLGGTILHWICYNLEDDSLDQTTKQARFLLELGAKVNAQDSDGNTPLHMAARLQPFNAQLVDLLIGYGAHVDMANADNETPMDIQPTDDDSVSELRYPVRHQTLQCLAARAVRQHKVPYEEDVPEPCRLLIEEH